MTTNRLLSYLREVPEGRWGLMEGAAYLSSGGLVFPKLRNNNKS